MTHANLRATIPDAIIIQADHFHFHPGERRRSAAVQSRRFFWCRSGSLRVTVNGEGHSLTPGLFIIMSWGHHVVYESARGSACEVGSVHLIPSHSRAVVPTFNEIPHDAGIWPIVGRSDVVIPGLNGIVSGDASIHRPLLLLAEYLVSTFRRDPDEGEQRALALQFVFEVLATLTAKQREPSVQLAAAIACLERPGPLPCLNELANAMKVSPSSAIRIFKRELGLTPRRFVIESRMRQAQHLLLGSSLPIGAISESLDMEPHYFSRLFRQVTGVSPRQYRARSAFI